MQLRGNILPLPVNGLVAGVRTKAVDVKIKIKIIKETPVEHDQNKMT